MPNPSKKQPELEEEEVLLPKPASKNKKKRPVQDNKKARKRKKSDSAEEQPSEDDVYAEEEQEEQEEHFEGEADEEQQVAEQPEEQEDNGDEGEPEEQDPDAARKRKMMRNRKAKLVGYRNLAKAVGYLDKCSDDAMGSAGLDAQACMISLADAVRCHRFVPATAGATTYGIDEYSKRHALFALGVPATAARESQVNLDLVLRSAMNEATVRAMEAGKKTISASIMQSVLRSAADNMLFTAVVPPLGLVRFGQSKGLLSSSEVDNAKKQEEKAEASKAKKMAAEYDKTTEERRAVVRKVRAAKKAALAGDA
tara:strand:+ start:1359 stop:2291 length:933 start_codon:yes stop_codon:yes gene_type:complete